MHDRKFERNYLTREYEEVNAANEGRTLGRTADYTKIEGYAAQSHLEGARLGLFQGCVEAFEKGNENGIYAFSEGTQVYMAEKGAHCFSFKTANQLCDAIDAFVGKHGNIAKLKSVSAKITGAGNAAEFRARNKPGMAA